MPEQKNAPLPDEVVEQMEEAAKEAVSQKFVNRYAKVKRSTLGGSVGSPDGRSFRVSVVTECSLSHIQESEETKIGSAEIVSIYTANKKGENRVSVEFSEEQIVENTDWEGSRRYRARE